MWQLKMVFSSFVSDKMSSHLKKFQCSFCPRKCKTEKQYRMHEATHAESAETDHNASALDKKVLKNEKEKKSLNDEDITTSNDELMIEIDRNELENLKKQAAVYDGLLQKCQELEKEIHELQIQNNITDDEIKKIDEELKNDVKKKVTSENTAAVDHVDNDKEEKIEETSPVKSNSRVKAKSTEASGNLATEIKGIKDDVAWDYENKTVPKDWMIGMSKSDKSKRKFKSPEGFVFESRVKALEFMINGEYPDDILSTMRLNLSDEGWYSDKSCPGKWKLRKIPGKKDYEYLSPTMGILPSMQAMLTFMQKDGNFTPKDIKNLEAKIRNIERTDYKKPPASDGSSSTPTTHVATVTEESLPGGWTKRKVGDSCVYISPAGTIVHTLQQMMASIEKDKVAEKEAVAEEVKTGEKRKFEDVFKPNKKEKLGSGQSSRKEMSESQLKILDEVFSSVIYPDSAKVKEISSETKLSQQDIKKWFVKKANEEAKKRLNNSGGKDPKSHKDSPKSKMIDSFKDLTKDHKKVLEEIFAAQSEPTVDMLMEVSNKLKIELNLLSKWFALRSQQRKKT